MPGGVLSGIRPPTSSDRMVSKDALDVVGDTAVGTSRTLNPVATGGEPKGPPKNV